MNYGILYSEFSSTLEGYSDANWISDSDEIKSTSGYVFTLGGGTISWKSAKQTIIARSTMKSEFVALELAGSEAEWLRNFLANIPLIKDVLPHVTMHCDCQAAIAIAKNKSYNFSFELGLLVVVVLLGADCRCCSYWSTDLHFLLLFLLSAPADLETACATPHMRREDRRCGQGCEGQEPQMQSVERTCDGADSILRINFLGTANLFNSLSKIRQSL
uniref:Uncharacterized protein LOC104221792 n=1 Tax=Nicotiana sylvestris TaxID=4096 RepID=A0A1U7WAH3_NICSY|nr:PREDICTED: uncharacterized protein LOC104221792 [Nicotiana sylvestris]